MADNGATEGRTRWTGCGFSPGKPFGSPAKTTPAQRPAPRSHKDVLRCIINRSVAQVVHLGAGRRIEEQLVRVIAMEVEHVLDRAGFGVERATAEAAAFEPVV